MIGREVSNRDVSNDYDLEALNPQYQYDHKQMVVGEIPLIGNGLLLTRNGEDEEIVYTLLKDKDVIDF